MSYLKEFIMKNEGLKTSTETLQSSSTPDKQQTKTMKTVSSTMGEIVWLMSQSSIHRYLSLADLEWLLMPPILLRQYKLYRDEGQKPIAAALWAYLSEESEKKFLSVGRLSPQDWGNNASVNPEKGIMPNAGGTLWLVELITPFHNETNNHREQIVNDLVNSTLTGQELKILQLNPETGVKEVKVLGKQILN